MLYTLTYNNILYWLSAFTNKIYVYYMLTRRWPWNINRFTRTTEADAPRYRFCDREIFFCCHNSLYKWGVQAISVYGLGVVPFCVFPNHKHKHTLSAPHNCETNWSLAEISCDTRTPSFLDAINRLFITRICPSTLIGCCNGETALET